MKAMIHGVICDPNRATLLAEGTNQYGIDTYLDLKRVELYRSQGGEYYFIQDETGYDMSLQLVSRQDAMHVYETLPEHETSYTRAFD